MIAIEIFLFLVAADSDIAEDSECSENKNSEEEGIGAIPLLAASSWAVVTNVWVGSEHGHRMSRGDGGVRHWSVRMKAGI